MFLIRMIVFIVCFLSMPAFANISVQGLAPASALSFTYMETANTNIIRNKEVPVGSFFLNTQYNYIDKPLVESLNDGSSRLLVRSLQALDIRSGVLLHENTIFSVNLSLNEVTLEDGKSRKGFGDSVAQLKIRLTEAKALTQFAVIPEVYIPIGDNDKFLSTGNFGGALRFALTRQFGFAKFTGNLGYRTTPGAKYRNIDYSKHTIAGLSSELQFNDSISLNLEGVGYFSVPYKPHNSFGEVYLGGLWAYSPLATISGGFSTGGLGGNSKKNNNSTRAIAGLKLFFDKKDEKKGCYIEPLNVSFFSRPLTAEENKRFINDLPYDSKAVVQSKGKDVRIQTLNYGESNKVTANGFPYVEDAQIPFAIDLQNLPPVESIKQINFARLKMRVNKLSTDNRVGTEFLCLINNHICSGQVISRDVWKKTLNAKYFSEDKKPANANFSKKFLRNAVATSPGKMLFSEMLTFSIDDLFDGSNAKVEQLFKTRSEGGVLDRHTLFFVVADDTFLSNETYLETSLGVERCM